jgi:predicted Zn finger-like uncharacterized protein
MKIVCGSCQAKYSIADEKVAGKVFKIRCKRCSEVIVVRGDQDGALPPGNSNGHTDADANEATADAIWHVVIHGEQAGPYSPAQLAELVQTGQLDWEAYVWSEGFENWQPMRDVPQLVASVKAAHGDALARGDHHDDERQHQEVASNSQPLQVAQPSMGADPFAEEAPVMYAKVAGDAVGGGRSVSHGGGGHASVASRSTSTAMSHGGGGFDTSPKVPVNAPSPRVNSEQAALTGVRNENSVLFSLKNLQALATGSGAPGAGPSNRPGYAGGEGSGLIDIRALATTTGVSDNARNSTEKDALLSLGSAQAGAFGALGSPMLSPAGKTDEEEGKKGLVLAIVGGFSLLAVAGIAIALIMKPSGQPAAIAPIAPVVAPQTAAAPAAAPTPAAAAAAAEPPSEGELAAQRTPDPGAAAKTTDASEEAKHGGKTPAKHASVGAHDEKPAAAAVATKSETEPSKPERPAKKAGGSIDDLLDNAIGGKSNSAGAKREAAAATANLQEKPSRDDVLSAMKGVTDAVKACGKGQTGVAFANVTVVGKTGRVSNVEVTGMTGDTGSCIARSVRKASFPKFSAENFQVKFPFRL